MAALSAAPLATNTPGVRFGNLQDPTRMPPIPERKMSAKITAAIRSAAHCQLAQAAGAAAAWFAALGHAAGRSEAEA